MSLKCSHSQVQRRAKKQMLFSDSFGSYRSDDDNTHSYHQVQKSSRYKLRSRGNKNKGKNHQLSKQPSFGEIVFKKKRPDFDAIEKHQLKTLVVKRDYDFRKAKPKEKMNPEHLKILHHALERYKLDNRFSRCFRNQSRATVDAMQCAVVEELQKCNLTASTINPNSLSLLESLIDSRNKIVPNNDSGDPSSLISNRTVPKVNLVTSCKTSDVDNFNHEKENTAKNGCSIIRQSLLQDVNSQFKQPLSNALLTSSSRSSNVPKSDGSYSRNVIGSSSGVKKKVVSFRETEATISMNEATIPNESLVAGSNLETLNRVTGVLKGDKFTSTPVNEPLTAIRCPLKNIHTSECRKTENKSFNAKASKSTLMTNIPNEALTTNSSQIVAAGTRKVVPEIYRNTMSRNHACLTPCISNISPILLAHTGSVLFNQSSSRCRLDYKSDEISDSSSEILDEADELNYKSSSHISSSNSLEPLFENQSNCSVFNKDGTINDKQALDFILSITNQCRSVTFNDVLPRR